MRVLAPLVLALVVLDELASWAAYGVWGASHEPSWLLVWVLPLAAIATWALLASPRARWGGAVRTPVTKVVVLGGAVVALLDVAPAAVGLGLGAFTVAVHVAAAHPGVRAVAQGYGPGAGG